MNEKTLFELKEMLEKDLDEITARGEMTASNLEKVDKITHTMKNINRIMDDCGYSEVDGYYERQRRYNRGSSYRDDNMYRNDRRYSMHDERGRMAEKIEEMMDEEGLSATDKAVLRRAMDHFTK